MEKSSDDDGDDVSIQMIYELAPSVQSMCNQTGLAIGRRRFVTGFGTNQAKVFDVWTTNNPTSL